jgi:hypothetical protein
MASSRTGVEVPEQGGAPGFQDEHYFTCPISQVRRAGICKEASQGA